MSQAEIVTAPRIEADPRRIHVLFGGHTVADSTNALVVREPGQPASWYFPRHDVEMLVLQPTGRRAGSPAKGLATYFTINRDASVIENAAWSFEDPPTPYQPLAGHIAFDPVHFDLTLDGHTPAEWAADHAARQEPLVPTATTFSSAQELAGALRRASAAHEAHEARMGIADAGWPDWYAAYMVTEQAGQDLPS
jgi:uncharacterized protein (DUF427 family)